MAGGDRTCPALQGQLCQSQDQHSGVPGLSVEALVAALRVDKTEASGCAGSSSSLASFSCGSCCSHVVSQSAPISCHIQGVTGMSLEPIVRSRNQTTALFIDC